MARTTQIHWLRRIGVFDVDASESDEAAEALRRALSRRVRRLPQTGVSAGDDLVQATLERLLTHYGDSLWTWDAEKRLAYAYQTLHRLFIDAQKRKRALLTATGSADGVETTDVEQLTQDQQLARVVQACLGALDPASRSFLLASFELDSTSEAQRHLGWPKGSAANACHTRVRLMRAIKDCLLRRGA